MRGAGLLVALQGVAALVMAAVLVVRGIAGADQRVVNGLGTAVWFVLVGGGVLAAGRALVVGKRWGRGLAVVTQLLLLPVAWYLAVGSHQPAFGIPVGILALTVLVLLFSSGGRALGRRRRSGWSCQLGQPRARQPIGGPLALRHGADLVVQRDGIDVPVQHRPRQPRVAVVACIRAASAASRPRARPRRRNLGRTNRSSR